MNKLYVYKGQKPVGIVENAGNMPIDEINRLARALKLLFDRDIHMKPIYPGDFDFDPETGRKLTRIDTFVYPKIKKEVIVMEKTHEFYPTDRYTYDFGLCSPKNGFSQIDTAQDAPYFGTWANPEKFVIFSYCEGDCTTTLCDNKEEFIAEINKCAEWNNENGYGFAIDPGLNPKNIKPWHELELGHFLH